MPSVETKITFGSHQHQGIKVKEAMFCIALSPTSLRPLERLNRKRSVANVAQFSLSTHQFRNAFLADLLAVVGTGNWNKDDDDVFNN